MTSPGLHLAELRGVAIPSRDDPTAIRVRGIDWTVRAGEFWVVAGPPGCGKSQLLETVAGLVPPVDGTVALHCRDAGDRTASPAIPPWTCVGLVFAEGGRPFNHLTVAENVGLPLCYHRGCTLAAVAAEVQQLLEWTGLVALSERFPPTLTRGMRQRLALARAMSIRPPLLLLDNPLNGLAVSQARWWIEFLGRLPRAAGSHPAAPSAVVVTTDDLRPWLGLGSDFALIDDRQWRRLGDRADVAASSDPAVRELLSDPN